MFVQFVGKILELFIERGTFLLCFSYYPFGLTYKFRITEKITSHVILSFYKNGFDGQINMIDISKQGNNNLIAIDLIA